MTITKDTPVTQRTFDFPGVDKCAVLNVCPGHIKLLKLEINPAYRGKGVGTRVLRELKRLGCTITLVAYPDDPERYDDLMRFYRRNGFEEVEGAGEMVWHP